MADNNDIQVRIVVATAGGKAKIKQFTGTADREFRGLKGSASKYLGAAGVAGIAAAAGGAIRAMVNRAIEKGGEFEQQMADISAITGIAGDRLGFLGDQALEQSTRFGEAASNIVEAQKLVASQLAEKIDFSTQEGTEQLADIAEQAIILQKAAGIDLRTAVQASTTAINQFNLDASETPRIINSIAAGAKFGAAEAANQADSYREAGSVFSSANEQFEVLNASTQVLAANAIIGRRAGTGLRNVMTILQSEAKKLADHGINDVNVQSDGFIESLRKLRPLMNDTAALAEIFGRENLTAAQILIKNVDALEQMTEKVTGTNTALEQANTQMDTFEGDLNKLTAAADRFAIALFNRMNPALRAVAQESATAVNSIAQILEKQGLLQGLIAAVQTGLGQGHLVAARSAMMQARELEKTTQLTRKYSDALDGTRTELMDAADSVKAYITSLEQLDSPTEQQNQDLREAVWLYDQLQTKIKETSAAQDTAADVQVSFGPGIGRAAAPETVSAQEKTTGGDDFMEQYQTVKRLKQAYAEAANEGKTLFEISTEGAEEADKSLLAVISATEALGGALAQAALHGKDLGDILEGLAKQLAAKAFVVGLGALLTGGASLAGTSFLGAVFGFKEGGAVRGPGTSTSDSIIARVSRGEHILSARDVTNLGGHRNVERIRKMAAMPSFRDGGPVLPSLGAIDRVVEVSRSRPHEDGFDKIVKEIRNQTRRLEQTERRVNFLLSDFDEQWTQYKDNENTQGRA